MLAVDRADRPASALEVLAALDADPRPDIGARMPPGPWSEDQLRQLFVDRRVSSSTSRKTPRSSCSRRPAATRGDRRALDRWIRVGLASWSGDGRVAITRSAIEQIAAGRPGSPQAELVSMLEAGADPEVVSAAARRIGQAMADAGHLERALAVLDAAELWARGTLSELGLLEDRVVWSLGLETAQACEQALYRVQRAEVAADRKQPLATLLRGGRAAFGGDPERALVHLATKPDGLPEPLEVWWHGARWKAVSQLDLETHERELLALEPWARSRPSRTSKWQGWLGYLRYRQQRYPEAAESPRPGGRPGRSPGSGP